MSRTVVPNTIVTVGNVVKIIIEKRDGTIYECLVNKYIYEYYRLDLYRWCIGCRGYVVTYITGKDGKQTPLLLHRLIKECPKDLFVDHISRNKLDNRLENLRIVTNQQNCMNQNKNSNNSSGIKGVYWAEQANKWYSQIKINYKLYHLGYYEKIFDATVIHVLASLLIHGEHTNYNNIDNIISDLKLALEIDNKNN